VIGKETQKKTSKNIKNEKEAHFNGDQSSIVEGVKLTVFYPQRFLFLYHTS
jgi:hypothetical protein